MDLTPHVAALRDDLAAAAAVGDEATSRAGTALAAALEPAMRLALMNALSELAAEVDGALEDRSVTLRLRGREVDVVVNGGDEPPAGGFFAGPSSSPFVGPGGRFERPGPPPGPHAPPGAPGGPGRHGFGGEPWGAGGPDVGDISRMTLRIVDQIKGQAERAAAAQGMSLNSWVSQAVQGALRGQGGWSGWQGGPPEGPTGAGGEPGAGRSERRGPDGGPGSGPGGGPGSGRGTGSSDDGDEGDGGVRGWVRG